MLCFSSVGKMLVRLFVSSQDQSQLDGIGNEHVNLQIFTAELCHSSDVFLDPLELLKATSTLVSLVFH